MKQLQFISFRILLCAIFSWGCNGILKEKSLSDQAFSDDFYKKINHVNDLFRENRYDSAEVIILQLKKENNSLLEKYLFYCYQAEVMYYNILPELASKNLEEAMNIAQKLNQPELIANCENYNGLFKIIEKKPEEAKAHLYKAEKLLPEGEILTFFVQDYQVLSNLAETHLMTKNPDSAMYYAKKGFEITQKKNIIRGTALNHWTMGQAYIQKGKIQDAKQEFENGLQIITGNENGDVLHYLYAGLIECASKENNMAEAIQYINAGKDSLVMQKSSVLGKTDFYRTASVAADLFGLKDLQIELEKKHLLLINEARENELIMQSKILSSYFEELNLVKQSEQEKRLSNRLIQGSLLFILLILVFVIYVNRKMLHQRIKFNQLESKSKIEILTKEKEMSEIIARNSAIEEERTRISKELHDDIGSSVSSIKIYNNLAQKQLNIDSEKIKELLEKSSTEIKQIEESLGDLIWAVYTKNETIQNLIMRMKQYAFDVLTAKDIHTEFDYPYQLDDIKLPIEFRKNMLLIFKEFVNNTAKYSDAKNFKFSFSLLEKNIISIKMQDDGIGFETTANTGKGLTNMQGRAKDMKANFSLISSPGNGSSLEITYNKY